MENLKQIIEGIIFTAGSEIAKKDILEKFEGLTMRELNAILKELCDKYSFEDSGVVLINLNNKVQFSSNPRYGDAIADALKKVKEKQLSAKVLDVLAIIAYKQPITRSEIEDFRSTSAEYALSVLLRAGLIVVLGRRETVGLPLEYGTTDEFLKKFNISSLAELPDAELGAEASESGP
ncbi:MAG TPA: SMC-Scp complex subunit ScpB, partial [Eubacteriales bacterium]|nr:SMC-Scp complex subunit ScpB [Eubacteriales bacterium]